MEARPTIISQFARWVAMSSARQAPSLRGHKWYPFIDNIDLDGLLREEKITPDAFAEWHEQQVTNLHMDTGVPIGWAAKIVNMLLKVRVYLAGQGSEELRKLIHPPVDNQLLIAA